MPRTLPSAAASSVSTVSEAVKHCTGYRIAFSVGTNITASSVPVALVTRSSVNG